jgi:hypothetical protein
VCKAFAGCCLHLCISNINPSWQLSIKAYSDPLAVQGDGLTMGGLIVLKKGGDVQYTYGEKTFGDHAPDAEASRFLLVL